MVGQKVYKSGFLDIKNPPTGFVRGWRIQPWKTRRVDLVEEANQVYMLHVYKDEQVEQTFTLDDVTDVTMIASKTHAHAFEIVAGERSLVIMSGSTELQSRDWIWALRKLFWPQAMVQLSADDKMTIKLADSEELCRHNIRGGIYDMDVSVNGIRLTFVSMSSAADSRLTPVQPFITEQCEPPSSFLLPLTTVGQYKHNHGNLEITTTPDSEFGPCTFIIEAGGGSETSIPTVLSAVKTAVFTACNCLHDAISASYWNQDRVT